jgi:NDP-sugar pyrophosphorylase family protein
VDRAENTREKDSIPHIIIPCCGEGKRFKDQGYKEPKPLIPVGGRRMLDWVLDVVPSAWRDGIIAVVKDNSDGRLLQDELWDWSWTDDSGQWPSIRTCVIPGPTQGAAMSVLAAAVGLPPNDPVLILNSDQWIKCNLEAIHNKAMVDNLDGFILTFPGTGPQWSYVVTDGTDMVVQVVEKKQVSDMATCGAYWWRRTGDLVTAICSMVVKNDRTNGEFYLAPSANHAQRHQRNIRAIPVEEFHGLGTPEQVKAFEVKLAEGWKP